MMTYPTNIQQFVLREEVGKKLASYEVAILDYRFQKNLLNKSISTTSEKPSAQIGTLPISSIDTTYIELYFKIMLNVVNYLKTDLFSIIAN